MDKNFLYNFINKVERSYNFKRIINDILKSNNNIYKKIISINIFFMLFLCIALLPTIYNMFLNPINTIVLAIHLIFIFIYYKLFKIYTINTYFREGIYLDFIDVKYSKKEIEIIKEIILFNDNIFLSEEKKDDFINNNIKKK